MNKRSVLVKILLPVMLTLVLPAMLSAGDPVCEPPYCQGACPDSSYDCTQDWIWSSWSNFQTACALWYSGYNILICCNN